jgi:hypothetical protein
MDILRMHILRMDFLRMDTLRMDTQRMGTLWTDMALLSPVVFDASEA